MNTDDELTRALRERADALPDTTIDLAGLRHRARGIRRRRRLAGTVVAAAVLAVGVPVGLALGDAADLVRPDSVAPAGPSPNGQDAPAPTPLADGSFRLAITDVPEGPAPEVGYIEIDAQRLVTPRGSHELPAAYPQVLPYGDGWLALRAVHSPPTDAEVAVLDADFEVVSSTPAGPAIAVGGERSDTGRPLRYAWVEYAGDGPRLVIAAADGSTPTRVPVPDASATDLVQAVAFAGEDVVLVQRTDPGTSESTYVLLGPEGLISPVPGFLRATDASAATGLVGGMVEYRPDGSSCSAAVDPSVPADPRWRTCDHTLGRFSPGGDHVIGLATQFDGPGSPTLAVLDAATGEPVVEFRPEGRRTGVSVSQAMWEDEDTVVAILTEGTDQAIVRLELDGSIERITGIHATEGLETELWFAAYPWQ